MTPTSITRFTTESLCKQFSKFSNKNFTYAGVYSTKLGRLRKSAILVPILIRDGEPLVLLTVRSSNLSRHKGEVACPGGMKDPTDHNEIETCLREAEEEVGLSRSLVKILCHLPPRVTRHKTLVHPVVGLIPSDFVPVLNEEEVESAFTLPLHRFLSDRSHTSQLYKLTENIHSTIHFFTDNVSGRENLTWGLTANILIEAAIALFQEVPSFQYDTEVNVTPADPFASQEAFLNRYHGVDLKNKL